MVGPTWLIYISNGSNIWFQDVGAYKVAVGVLIGSVPSSIEEDGCTFSFSRGDQFLNALLAFRADDGTEVSALFETTVDIQLLGPCSHLWQPLFGLTNHDSGTESHAPLSGSTEGGTHNSVKGLVFVAFGEDGSVVLRAQVRLDTLAVGRTTVVNVFTRAVAADETNRLDGRRVQNEVYRLGGTVDDVDNTRRETGLLGQVGQNHSRARVPLRRLHHNTVASDGSDGERPERNHGGEV